VCYCWQWRNLPAQEKQCWEEKAAKVNEESAAKFAQEEAAIASASPNTATPASVKLPMNPSNCSQDQAVENLVYECCWDNCDWQFEDLTDCIDHCIQEPNGHVHQHFANIPPQGKVLHNTRYFIHSSEFHYKDMKGQQKYFSDTVSLLVCV
jgi:protein polybromo-1